MGAKIEYSESFLPVAEQVFALGGTLAKLGEALAISESTVQKLKKEHPELQDAINRGKDRYNREKVECALLERALGGTYETKKTKRTYLKGKSTDGTDVKIPAEEVRTEKKHLPPDVTAMIFYLVNRHRYDENPRWVNLKQVQEHTGTVNHRHEHQQKEIQDLIGNLPKEQLEQLGEILFKKPGSGPKRVEEGDGVQGSEKVRNVQLEDG